MVAAQKTKWNIHQREVVLDVGGESLEGTLAIPEGARGLVLFAHGSGSSRHSPRNRFVAQFLQSQRIATLLFDLLTRHEGSVDERTAEHRFDIPFLSKRLIGATEWVLKFPVTSDLSFGYFGASTGAAAALVAAAELPAAISSVVSRGGRPDLAAASLRAVHAPTLLIVGGHDYPVIDMNREALAALECPEKQLLIIPGATHLFEEPGTLEEVARVAAEWFVRHFKAAEEVEPQLAAARVS